MRDFLPAKLWWIGWSDNLHLATLPKMHTFPKWDIELSAIHSLGPRSPFLSRILQFLRVLCFRAYHQKGHCSTYRRFDGDMKTLWWNNMQPISLCNQCAHKRMNDEERFKVSDFKSQFRMKPLKKLSYGKFLKLLYVAACVGFFFEEAYECLVHYVSK